jgi:hypothetical protein
VGVDAVSDAVPGQLLHPVGANIEVIVVLTGPQGDVTPTLEKTGAPNLIPVVIVAELLDLLSLFTGVVNDFLDYLEATVVTRLIK